jgi:hypothetical protein
MMKIDRQEFSSLDFRQLVTYVEAAKATETAGGFYDWRLLIQRFTEGLVAHCRELTEAELRTCVELAEDIFRGAEQHGDHERRETVHRRFMLSASLLERLGPRQGIRFLEPATLLRDYLAELPMPLAQARQKAARWPTLDISEIRKLREPKWHMIPLKRIDHLFPESADRDEYRKWKELWPELP